MPNFMLHHYILDINHNPVVCADVLEWAKWFGEIENKRVGYTVFINKEEVSTVFLGLDHNYARTGPPILFETMIFCVPESSELDQYQERCSTWSEAQKMHDRAVKLVQEKYYATQI